MQLATDQTDFSTGALGMVELFLSYMNDRQKRYWSKAEAIEYINRAQLKIAMMMNRFHEEHFITSATTPLQDDQAYYSFPSDMVNLVSAPEILEDSTDEEGKELMEVHIKDRRFYELLAEANQKEEYHFFFISGTNFKLMPRPGTAGNAEMRVHYVKRLSTLVDNTDVSEIPEDYHEMLVIDAARRGYVKVNRQNPQLERLWAESVELLNANVSQLSPWREHRVEPFYGTYGPGSDLWEYVFGYQTEG